MADTNSFGTFLETRQLLRKGTGGESAAGEDQGPLGETAKVEAPVDPTLNVLRILGTHDRLSIPELLAGSGLSLEVFTEALKQLQDADLVSVGSENGKQVAALSERGAQLKLS